MKNTCTLLFLILFSTSAVYSENVDADKVFDIKQNAYALYNTNHLEEAFNLLNGLKLEDRDEEVYLIMANIKEDKGKLDDAVALLNLAIKKNPKFYKGYYNLGCIFMKKRTYSLAVESFENAAKYNKENPYVFYNLACAQINMNDYKNAKKNLIKAIYLKNDEKDFYYNLAYVNKKLGKEKQAQKIIDFYNSTFLK